MSKIYEYRTLSGDVKGAVALDSTLDNKALGDIGRAFQQAGLYSNVVECPDGVVYLTLPAPPPPNPQKPLPFDSDEDHDSHEPTTVEQERINVLEAWKTVWSGDDEQGDFPGTSEKKADLVSRTDGRISALCAGIAPATDDDLLNIWQTLYPGVDPLAVADAVASNDADSAPKATGPRIDVGPDTPIAGLDGLDVREPAEVEA